MQTNNQKNTLVMMSTYNGEKYLRTQIESIINQKTDSKIFLQIRDDGSTDSTCEIIKDMMKQYPDSIGLVKGKNIGCNGSFFELIRMAKGYDYYSISDQDDVWLEDKIQTAISYLERDDNNIPLLYASTSYLVEDDLIPYGMTRKKQREFVVYNTIIQNICPGHTQVMNNKLLQKVQEEIDVSKIYVYDLWITNMAALYGKILFDNTPHTYYRQHQGNQLGSGKSFLGKLLLSVKHTKAGHDKKFRRQIEYFTQKNKRALEEKGYYLEIERFLKASNRKFPLAYCFSSKLFRQSKLETFAFYVAVLIGRF